MVFWRFIFEITHHSLKTRQGHNHRTHNGHSGDLGFDAKSGQLEINPQCPQISTIPASNIINTATAATSPLSKLPRHHPENAIARPAQQMLKRPNVSSKQTGDLPTSPPAGSAETDWICCGARLGNLSHGRGAIDWQMKQEKKKSERERREAAPASLVEQRGW
jgi:hypothetical protein